MLNLKTKEKRELLKWSKQNNPLMFLVLTMDGKWEAYESDAENISVHFLKCWPAAKEALRQQNLKRLDEFSINYPDDEDLAEEMEECFLLITDIMPDTFEEAKRYEESESYCRELLDMFEWESFEAEEFWGHIGFCLDRQDRIEERDALFTSHEMTETMAQYYSLCFLERGDADRAEEIMSPYKDSKDDVTEARFTWIDDLRRGGEEE